MKTINNMKVVVIAMGVMLIGGYMSYYNGSLIGLNIAAAEDEAKDKVSTPPPPAAPAAAEDDRKIRTDNSPVRFDKWGEVDENVVFNPGLAPELKTLQDRGSFDPGDFYSEEEMSQRQSLIEIESKVDANNPVYLSGTGAMAGTGDVRQGYASSAARMGSGEHPKALEISGLNLDEFGLVNWADAIRKGKISPLAGLTEDKIAAENYEEYIIVFQAKSDYMNDVVFPHDIHSYWLDCSNCHKKIFIPKAGANPITMKKIVAGDYCGRCHGKVAFPLEECRRCHVKPKGGGALSPYPIFDQFQAGYDFK